MDLIVLDILVRFPGLLTFMVLYLLVTGGGIALYILQSLGLYTIAARRELKCPWLAWLPIGNMWILGTIADQYQYVVKGRARNYRKVILGLSIAMVALTLVLLASWVTMLANIFVNMLELQNMSPQQVQEMVMEPFLQMIGTAVLAELLSLVLCVFRYIALYSLYCSCEPKNNVLYLLLSILFQIAMPITIFLCRNKDLGMPPRRDTVASGFFTSEQPNRGPEF